MEDVMTTKEYVQSRTTEELKEELKALEGAIDWFDCFSTQDLALREAIEQELEERGAL